MKNKIYYFILLPNIYIKCIKKGFKSYLLLTQPLTPKAPLRFLELMKEYCPFDFT